MAGTVVLALVVLAGIIGSLPTGNTPGSTGWATTVRVSSVDWNFSGAPSCWSSTTTPGFSVEGGSTFEVSLPISYSAGPSDPSACVVRSVVVQTSGFQLLQANTPLNVTSGSSATLRLELRGPSANASTSLGLDANVSGLYAGQRVNLTAVNWNFPGASNCWSSASTPGLSVAGGSSFTVSIRLSYTAGLLEPASCTVQTLGVSTSGFSVSSSNTPLVVSSGGSATLTVTLVAPQADETVALGLVGQTTSP